MKLPTLVAALTMAAVPGFAGAPALANLQPGAFRSLPQNLKVNIVFLGYGAGTGVRDVDVTKFRAALPAGYQTIHRYPNFYGNRQGNGVDFTYNYSISFAPQALSDSFFAYLTSTATPAARTLFQDTYNAQTKKSAVSVGQNHFIDAPSVEKWLAANGPLYGIDTSKYTVFFVNWYGRPDFRFHVYTKTDEPDPDTGYNFGVIRASRKVIGWGGSASRVWFYDLSAGPDSWTGNYDVDSADIDGNGVLDYRIPPVWEYGNLGAYRPFNDLTGDLAKVTRYVALNLLFTSSPLYKPALSPPKLPKKVQIDVNLYQGIASADARAYYKPAHTQSRLAALQPYNDVSVQVTDQRLEGNALKIYTCFLGPASCYGNRLFGDSFGDLFLYHNDHLLQFLEGDADYEVPVFGYFVPPALSTGGLLGFADDNWRDGTQSFVFAFLDPGFINAGYGLTTTITHEVGHHLGMSHPHDGYDSETGTDYDSSDAFYYAWAGDESYSIMHYLDLATGFGQFDRDNMSRYMTAAYLNQANAVLAAIDKSPRAGGASFLLYEADMYAGLAINRYGVMAYPEAAAQAQKAFEKVLAAAASINVKVEPQNYTSGYKAKGKSPKFVDGVGYPARHRNQP